MLKKGGIALKTFIFTAIIITLSIMASFGIFYFILPDYYRQVKSNALQKSANILAQELKAAQSEEDCARYILKFASDTNSIVISFDSNGIIIPSLASPFMMMQNVDENAFTIKIDSPAAPIHERQLVIKSSVREKEVRQGIYYQNSLLSDMIYEQINSKLISYLMINYTLQPIDEAKSVMLSLLPYLLVIDLTIALAASYLYSRQLTKPILKISNAAAEMQRRVPNAVSDVKSNDELGELSQNLDLLYLSLCSTIKNLEYEMEKVNLLEQSKADFMRAAGHELKTPIAALNGMLEGMIDNIGAYRNKDKYLPECKNLVVRLAGLVNEILAASKIENIYDNIVIEPIDISEIIEQALGGYMLFIEEKELKIIKQECKFIFNTDRHMIFTVLSNIISNAVYYTKNGGLIRITISDSASPVLSIENECEDISAENLQKLCEPFYTLNYSRDKSKNGTGLGLYIVKRSLETLKIPFAIENTNLGLKFDIFLKDHEC